MFKILQNINSCLEFFRPSKPPIEALKPEMVEEAATPAAEKEEPTRLQRMLNSIDKQRPAVVKPGSSGEKYDDFL